MGEEKEEKIKMKKGKNREQKRERRESGEYGGLLYTRTQPSIRKTKTLLRVYISKFFTFFRWDFLLYSKSRNRHPSNEEESYTL